MRSANQNNFSAKRDAASKLLQRDMMLLLIKYSVAIYELSKSKLEARLSAS
jgi:hypothetical protein